MALKDYWFDELIISRWWLYLAALPGALLLAIIVASLAMATTRGVARVLSLLTGGW